MTTVAIIPEGPGSPAPAYRAVAGKVQAGGKAGGQALDALAAQLDEAEAGTLVIVQHRNPDDFFTREQQERLQDLMERWRTARDAGTSLSVEEQAELDALVEAELRGAAARAAALARGLNP